MAKTRLEQKKKDMPRDPRGLDWVISNSRTPLGKGQTALWTDTKQKLAAIERGARKSLMPFRTWPWYRAEVCCLWGKARKIQNLGSPEERVYRIFLSLRTQQMIWNSPLSFLFRQKHVYCPCLLGFVLSRFDVLGLAEPEGMAPCRVS